MIIEFDVMHRLKIDADCIHVTNPIEYHDGTFARTLSTPGSLLPIECPRLPCQSHFVYLIVRA